MRGSGNLKLRTVSDGVVPLPPGWRCCQHRDEERGVHGTSYHHRDRSGEEQLSAELVRGAALASGVEFGLEVVDQVDDVVAAATGAHSDASAGDSDGEMGLAGAGAAGELLDQGIVDR